MIFAFFVLPLPIILCIYAVFMNKTVYYIVFAFVWLLSVLPLWILYRLSDGLYYIMYYVVRYRRRLVRKNLTDSFPDKAEEEIADIEKKFYSWLCDYFVETIKLLTISEKEIRRRMRFEGVELLNKYVDCGRSCAVYLGHYCNWEWVTSLPLWTSEKAVCGQIYHVLENKYTDKLMIDVRSRLGATCIPMAETLRQIINYRNEGKAMIIGFIADQTPFWHNIHYWTNFLNHEKTPVFTGTERIIKKVDFATFYLDIRCERRGCYVAEFKLLTDIPKDYVDYEITEMATKALEQSIYRQPYLWLWTHNRWKRTYERWLEKMGDAVHRHEAENIG